jgi:hypothetical protein
MTAPPWLRMGSTSIGFLESNSSHTVSARRNNAAGVAAENEKLRRRPSLSRLALTLAALSPDLISGGGGADAARAIFGGTSAAAAGGSFDGGVGIWASDAGGVFGARSGLISILACWASVSDVGGAISPPCRGAAAIAAALSDTAGTAGTAGAGACEASDIDAGMGAFSACWNATSMT